MHRQPRSCTSASCVTIATRTCMIQAKKSLTNICSTSRTYRTQTSWSTINSRWKTTKTVISSTYLPKPDQNQSSASESLFKTPPPWTRCLTSWLASMLLWWLSQKNKMRSGRSKRLVAHCSSSRAVHINLNFWGINCYSRTKRRNKRRNNQGKQPKKLMLRRIRKQGLNSLRSELKLRKIWSILLRSLKMSWGPEIKSTSWCVRELISSKSQTLF